MNLFGTIKKYGHKIIVFLKEAHVELKKVQWPTRKEAVKLTLIVIGFSVAVAVFLGVIDYILTVVIEEII